MRNIFLAIVLTFVFTSTTWASVAGDVNKANGLYSQGKFDDSLGLYQKALAQNDNSPVIKYDLGTALYKKGDYAKALEYLSQAAQDKNIKIKPLAQYNLGNVLYKSGMQKENSNIDEAIKSLQDALGYYGQSLEVNPKDQDAVFNEDVVKKEIERLKQKKQQQQKQNQKQNQNQQNQKGQNQNQQKKEAQQNQQQQQNQQSQGNQQKQQNKEKQGQQNKSQNQKQQNGQDQSQETQKDLDRKQAENMLEEYRENEEPKKLLNYMPKKIDDRPVLKDW